ncbi:arginine/ornithine antiporter ArcD [Hydrogenimonas sp.]|nr:arginine/ornithine antiporter ArcD [Hydrogenimonas sp.]
MKRGGMLPSLLLLFFIPSLLFSKTGFILVNDGVMPPKQVEKMEQMGEELYSKTGVAAFVAAVAELNKTKPVDLIEDFKEKYPDYILLYFSMKPKAVNIFASKSAEKLIDIEQILSPLPWRGTIKPVMSPAFSKSESVKNEVALFNGYADIVDQAAESRGVKLESSIGSGSKDSFKFIRWIFYAILTLFFIQYIIYKVRSRRGES